MRHISIILSILCLSFLSQSCNEGKIPTTETQKTDSVGQPSSMAGLKVAYVNTDSILDQYMMMDDLEEELIQEKILKENQLQSKVQQLEKEFEYAQTQIPTMSQEKVQMLQYEFQQKEQALRQSQGMMEQELYESEQRKNDRLFGNIRQFLDDYSEQEGYDFIFGYNGLGNVMYANQRFDITNICIDSLNVRYQKEKGMTP